MKASTVRQFLVSSGLSSKKAEQTAEKSTEELAEIPEPCIVGDVPTIRN